MVTTSTTEEITEHTNQKPNPKPKKKNHGPEAEFRRDLDTCSKNNDLPAALSLYQTVLSSNICLSFYHFNALLHLCSSSLETLDSPSKQTAMDSSFQIFDRMIAAGINPTEAALTAMARIAAHRSDGGGELGFDLVRTMREKYGAVPKLRTYGPALYTVCNKLEADRAYDVENHMGIMGISPEEQEIAALFEVRAKKGREEKVY